MPLEHLILVVGHELQTEAPHSRKSTVVDAVSHIATVEIRIHPGRSELRPALAPAECTPATGIQ